MLNKFRQHGNGGDFKLHVVQNDAKPHLLLIVGLDNIWGVFIRIKHSHFEHLERWRPLRLIFEYNFDKFGIEDLFGCETKFQQFFDWAGVAWIYFCDVANGGLFVDGARLSVRSLINRKKNANSS